MTWGQEFRVYGLGLGLGFRVYALGPVGFRVLGCKVKGLV